MIQYFNNKPIESFTQKPATILNQQTQLPKKLNNPIQTQLPKKLNNPRQNKKTNTYFMYDRQFRNVGSNIDDNEYIKEYFSRNTVDLISDEITKQLKGVEKHGKDIIVPDDKIFWVMNTVYDSFNYPQGFDTHFQWDEYLTSMIDQTIERIVFDVKNTLGYEQCMNGYTAWTMVLGDFNEKGLRSHAPVKIRNKHPNHMQFFERY